MKIIYVEYHWGDGIWAVDCAFPDRNRAESYLRDLAAQTRAGVSGSLDGYTLEDFRIIEREIA